MNVTEAGDMLALINASLNATSAIALVTGFIFIRKKVVDRHRKTMLTAVGASGIFLVFYVTRVILTGTHQFAGEGLARIVYLSVLFSHVTLAIVVFPVPGGPHRMTEARRPLASIRPTGPSAASR